HLFSLSLPMQRRKGVQGDKLFALPSLTELRYKDGEGLRAKLLNRNLCFSKKHRGVKYEKG
ncbi:unnamed protein product, partial [marine sediment metagenome]